MKTTNFFGHEIIEISTIVQDPRTRDYLQDVLVIQLGKLGVTDPPTLAQTVLRYAQEYGEREYEIKAYTLLQDQGILENIQVELEQRACVMYGEIVGHICGSRILDYGCGNGLIAQMLALQGHDVTLADVYRISGVPEDMSFIDLTLEIPTIDFFDTSLLLTVLHHADNPLASLQQAISMVRNQGRVLVIESVYGIGIEDDPKFGQLSLEQQWIAAAFIDHFANRVLYDPQDKMNLPYNYQTPKQWRKTFEDHGLRELQMVHLRVDLPVFPEYHTLHVLEVDR